MKKLLILVPMLILTGVLSASAQTQTPVVDKREQNQRARIREGAASGDLTRKETARARQDQRSIRRTERRAKADGEVTNKEKARLQHKQNKASRSLRRNKHDDQARPDAN